MARFIGLEARSRRCENWLWVDLERLDRELRAQLTHL